jgi:fumarate hydratase subunit alpha
MNENIARQTLIDSVEKMILDANRNLDLKAVIRLQLAMEKENSDIAKRVLSEIIENQEIARKEQLPMCQDTGVAVFIVEMGNEVYLDFDLIEALNQAVHNAYTKGYLRKSVVQTYPLNVKTHLITRPQLFTFTPLWEIQWSSKWLPKGLEAKT